jgi:hypothetical protein
LFFIAAFSVTASGLCSGGTFSIAKESMIVIAKVGKN